MDLFPEAVAQVYMALDAEAMQTNAPVVRRQELPPIYGKGKRTAILRVAPISSTVELGARGTVSILHDTTETELESARLRYLTTQLKLALDTSGFGGWVWDLEGDILTCSEQYQNLLGYRGQNFRRDFVFRDRLHPDDRERVLEAVRLSIKENSRFEQAYRLQRFDGQYQSFRGSGHAANDAQGKRYFAGLLVPSAVSQVGP